MTRKLLRAALKAAAPQGTASAVFATLGVVDLDGDVIRPGALREGAPVVVSGFGHSAVIGPTAPAGRGVIRIAGNKAVADVRFFLGTAAGRDAHEVVRELGDLCEWSFAFDVVKSSYGKHEGRHVRFLDDLDAYEVSPVVRGAGIGTGTLVGSVKSTPAGPDRAELAAIRARLMPDRAELRAIKDRLQLCAIRDEIRAKSRRYYSECRPPGPELVALAESTLRITARDLGIDPPPLRWCAPETAAEAAYADTWGHREWAHFVVDEPVRGAFAPATGTVWVAAHLDAADLVATVAHEVGHAAGGDEAQAQRYERRYRLTADAN